MKENNQSSQSQGDLRTSVEALQIYLNEESHKQGWPNGNGILPLSLEDDITSLVDRPDVGSVAVLLGVDAATHGRLADDIQGAVGDQGEDVELCPATVRLQNVAKLGTVSVHHTQEVLQYSVELLISPSQSPKCLSHLKWKAGVSSFLLECHFAPVLVSSPVPNHGIRNL